MAAREPQWRHALSAVVGGMSIRKASKTFQVDRESLRCRLHRTIAMDAKRGPKPKYLSREQEKEVVEAIAAKIRMGLCLEKPELRSFIRQSALTHNPDAVTAEFPNKEWLHRFIKRHKAAISLQKPPRSARKRAKHSTVERALLEVQANETEVHVDEMEVPANEREVDDVEEDMELRAQQSPLSTSMQHEAAEANVPEVTAAVAVAEETGGADGDSQRRLERLVNRMERDHEEQRRHADEHIQELQLLQRVQLEAQQTQHAQLLIAIQQQQSMMLGLIKTVAALAKNKE